MNFKQKMALFSILFSIAIVALIFSSVSTALAVMQKDLSISFTELQWITNIFGLFICSSLVIMGRLADMFGRKRLFIIGLIGLGIAMIGAGTATHAGQIIFFQGMLGLCSAILLPVSQVLITQAFPEGHESKAIGIWAAVIGIALAAGPLLSGSIVTFLGWRCIYFFTLPFIAISLLLAIPNLSESKDDTAQAKIDWLGALLLIITIGSFVLAVIEGQTLSNIDVAGLYTTTVIALGTLLYVEKKTAFPIIEESLFKNKQFLIASFANMCLIFFVWAAFFFVPLYLQNSHSFSSLGAGLMMLFVTVPLTILSFAGGKLAKKFQARTLISWGLLCLTISACLQLYFKADSGMILLITTLIFFGLGWGFSWGPTTTTALAAASKDQAGIAAGTFTTIQEVGGTIGLAITAAVARTQPSFLAGFHHSLVVLIVLCAAGFITTLGLKNNLPK